MSAFFDAKKFAEGIKEKEISPIYKIEVSANLYGGACRLVYS